MNHRLSLALLLSLPLAWFSPAHATVPNGLNLGATSFLDGAPPAGPGFYFTQYVEYYQAGTLAQETTDIDIDLNLLATLSQFIYLSDQPVLLGGKWGIDAIVPVVTYDLNIGPNGTSHGGLGDVYVGPFVQWDPVMGQKGPIFMQRIEAQFILPTADYDSGSYFNPFLRRLGNDSILFNPYWAGTFFLSPKWTVSARAHLLWSSENRDRIEFGEAFHVNFATEYEILAKQLRVGLNGYYFSQFSDDQFAGRDLEHTAAHVLGIGPGLIWHINPEDHLFLNAFWETAAHNTTEGSRFVLRWVHHF